MGQAKQRGTFEQRKADAVQREAERMERWRKEREARQEAERRAQAARHQQRPTQRITGGMSSRSVMLTAAMVALSMGASYRRDDDRTPTPSAAGQADGGGEMGGGK